MPADASRIETRRHQPSFAPETGRMGLVPEGDTVWNTARMLHRTLAAAQVRSSDLRVPALATVDLSGWTVRECASRGKHLLLRLSQPDGGTWMTLHSHLRMDGAWRVYPAGGPRRGGPAHAIRAVLATDSHVAVGYQVHDLALVPTADEDGLVGHLGPDLLGPPGRPGGWDAGEAVRRLLREPDRPIGEALLDQRNLAGIGNLYKSEVLFLRGVWPWAPVSKVGNPESLVSLARRLLAANRERWTQVTTGSTRRGEEVYVYRRAGSPCRRCGSPIRQRQQADRVTYWCPTCQPVR